ncbi:anti-sigma factor antagonist [Streptomyces sp. CC208A]|uniref:anti-sigma factor antagonist n=1 Tax=Streptomyces sp. CC208A TaxID=3044573 RepID=UPI0024A9F815|nr:anti-sigma factor antagonist [Streptomyces sp. CC208A]
MTIEWRYTIHPGLGVLSLAGFLGQEAVGRFQGAVGWALARGTGPVVLDLTGLRGWSDGGRLAVSEAAVRLAAEGRGLELAAAPEGGPLGDGRVAVAVHGDLASALAAHRDRGVEERAWRSDAWPGEA